MKRILVLFVALLAAPWLAPTLVTPAHAAEYELITPPQPTDTPGKVQVIEMFWYGCPHCYELEPILERWLKNKPDNVEFIRMPAILNPSWALDARAYYTGKVLGVADKLNRPLFDAIHAERRDLNDEKSLEDFYVENGVDRTAFRKAWNSFGVDTMVRRARVMTERYGVTGTPTMIVNGKYRTDGAMTGSFANMLRVVDELIAHESKNGKS